MKDKGKGAESGVAVVERSIVPSLVIENPVPIFFISAIFEEPVTLEDLAADDDEEDDEEDDDDDEDDGEEGDDEEDDDDEKVFSASSHAFDINYQPEYEYKYVEDADIGVTDMYDRVEVEDCTDDESVSEDTSQYPTLMEFFTEENRDELRRKVADILKDKNFDGTLKDMQKEERQKWSKNSHERKFKRPLKFYQRDRSISLGDIISWGFLPHVNAYAIRREFGVQYFERLYDIMLRSCRK
ncbi:nonsense-mediated mRNA decay protein 2-like [Helianthus annuus]|uniref:nonsense-mediated mRNA decay protein 2-like n=1 Tax=Helianthus annuus TaxID=4232 RepID=UPI000B90A42F|nr:nonsense-mediated mRNA decay protein 2-like [Helianthus annuus]